MIDWDAVVGTPCQDVFGEPVDYRPLVGAPLVGIVGIFDEGYFQPTLDDETPASSVQPTLGVQVGQFPTEPVQNDRLRLVRTGQWYIVGNTRPDSHGGMRLMLNKCRPPVGAS